MVCLQWRKYSDVIVEFGIWNLTTVVEIGRIHRIFIHIKR